jgi:hypothetical protein
MNEPWIAVEEQLDRARDAGRSLRFWLRDDDAVTVTPALERLRDLCVDLGMPVLLAVIPAGAQPALASWIEANPSFTPCQHGYAHSNYAAAGARACELGGERPSWVVLEELRRGRARLQTLFGARLSDILVPPWNRIDPALPPLLPGLGFEALSTFGPPPEPLDRLRHLNCDLDIIDWRNGRIGRSAEDICGKLAGLIAQSRDSARPIGILTHHLAHDAQAWTVLETVLQRLETHPAAHFVNAGWAEKIHMAPMQAEG